MRHVGWPLCVALALLVGGTGARAEEPPPSPEELNRLLQRAAQAYGRDDPAEARRELRAALTRISPQDFQRRLLHVAQLHDDGRVSQASSLLHMAAQLLTPWVWFAVGLLGQAIFCGRFVVQWIASERKKQSVVPVAFWYLSILGSLTLLAYALSRWDPVFILAYVLNSMIYVRNLMLIHRRRGSTVSPAAAAGG
ncbi:MAG TPA: lipid-A-disaccharide synthase N-terminal domain-containing protein [Planctomycetota bacterium]|nr:lipid-A-disaccharide synthase N-terminal domain-containing protein [Planctomycetota bacterium]